MLPIGTVQTALYTALTAALAPTPVLDDAGENRVYPYATIGEAIAGHADTLSDEGVDIEMTIHFWSRQPGMQECLTLMEKAKNALHRRVLPVTGFQWVTTIWTDAQTLRDADGKTRHGILRFRVLTFEAAGAARS